MNDLKSFLESLAKNVTFSNDPATDTERVRAFRAEKTGERITAAALMQPSNNAFLPGGVAYQQQPFIGSMLLPEVSASPDGTLKASFFSFGKESLLNASAGDEIGTYGEHKRADLGVSQTDITLVKHGMSAWIDPDERSSYEAVGINIEDEKAKLIRTQVETRKEGLAASLVTTYTNYSSATHYTTLTGTDQWSHSSADPLGQINAKIEVLRGVLGQRPNVLWMSPSASSAVRLHPNIIKYVNGGATKQNPAVPISAEIIGSILGVRVLIGEAIAATTPGGTVSDIWGDYAGLLFVGGTGMYDLKFGCTLVSSGYPIQRVERDPHKGSKGIDVLYYDDAYKHAVQLATAGFLWQDVTA
jgi:hypothetical protein